MNAMAESFFGTLQLELLDRRHWETTAELASAIFEYIEAFYNPRRRHSSIGNLSPVEFETRSCGMINSANPSGETGKLIFTLNTKHQFDASIWVAGNMLMNGRRSLTCETAGTRLNESQALVCSLPTLEVDEGEVVRVDVPTCNSAGEQSLDAPKRDVGAFRERTEGLAPFGIGHPRPALTSLGPSGRPRSGLGNRSVAESDPQRSVAGTAFA